MLKNRVVLIILIIAALLVISGVAYYQYTNRELPEATPQTRESTKDRPGETEGIADFGEEPLEPNTLRVYFIDLENKRGVRPTIGCGDSVYAYTVDYPTQGKNTEELITAALNLLLAEKNQEVSKGGAYNSLYQSDLKVDRVDVNDSVANVYLTGEVKLGGTCDNPRFETQLRRTAWQFEEITSVNLFLNGEPLNLSLR